MNLLGKKTANAVMLDNHQSRGRPTFREMGEAILPILMLLLFLPAFLSVKHHISNEEVASFISLLMGKSSSKGAF